MTKEKPVIFSTPIIQALLNTKPGAWPPKQIDPDKPFKSQTRLVIKPQPRLNANGFWELYGAGWSDGVNSFHPIPCHSLYNHIPYKPGDILWVRETWNKHPDYKKCINPKYCDYCKHIKTDYIYYASFPVRDGRHCYPCCGWKPSTRMPREAARIFLEVKSVRVRRLQEMCVADCVHEGAEFGNAWTANAKPSFIKLWDSINAKRGHLWKTNPWVWVYEFMRVKIRD